MNGFYDTTCIRKVSGELAWEKNGLCGQLTDHGYEMLFAPYWLDSQYPVLFEGTRRNEVYSVFSIVHDLNMYRSWENLMNNVTLTYGPDTVEISFSPEINMRKYTIRMDKNSFDTSVLKNVDYTVDGWRKSHSEGSHQLY